mmetsp:Transcript_15569/g.64605  ORF Transcript_15569/g.64605 Transcript_15569/m.64605 type:complete len:213 (+) Transcript_15569:1450-2088(+)
MRVLEELLVVRANVELDGQTRLRVEATPYRIELQLADGYAQAARAEITQAEDAAAVRNHDDLRTWEWPVVTDLAEVVAVGDGEVHALRRAEEASILLARLSNCRRVHDRKQLLHVLLQRAEEERGVMAEQRRQVDVALQIGVLRANLVDHAVDLLLEVFDRRRHEAAQAKVCTRVRLERGVPIVQRVVEERPSPGVAAVGPAPAAAGRLQGA